MKNNISFYVADLFRVKSGYDVIFHDFAGCVTHGKTIDDAIKNAKIALQIHIDGMFEDGEKIPKPSSLEKVIKDSEYSPDIRVLIEVKLLKEKKKRIDITLDENLISMIDNISSNRSEFITSATKEYLKTHYNF